MKITPIDIQQVGFAVRFRGYDRREVDNFLDALVQDYETLIKETQDARERGDALENELMEIKKKEATLNSALVGVQKVVDEMKRNSQKEVDLVLKEAEIKAEEITKGALDDRLRIHQEISELQRQKILFLENVRSLLRTFEKTLEMEEKDPAFMQKPD